MHKVYHIFRFSLEAFSQLRVLGRDANRTGIQVADTHHDAAHGYQRSGCETELLGTQNAGNSHITSGHQLTVSLQNDFVSQAVHDQGLMCLSHAKLPRKSRIVDGVSRSSTGTAVKTGYQDNLCTCLCNTGCYGSHTSFRYQFYRDPCSGVGIL